MSGSPWTAVSPCTAACVTSCPQAGARVGRVAAARRYAACGAALAAAAAAGRRLGDRDELRRRARSLLGDLGVALHCPVDRLTVPGAATGTLVVANHISWLDAIAVLAVQPVTLLAKREVGAWPLVGTLVRRAGTRFIDRADLRGLPATVRDLAALLRAGESVVVFPEGTTWCSAPGGTFRRAMFQAAVDAGAPVRPVTLSYACHGAPTTLPAYVGDATFTASLRRIATAPALSVRVTPHPALDPAGHTRRSLAALARAVVSAPAPDRPPSHRPAAAARTRGPGASTPAPA